MTDETTLLDQLLGTGDDRIGYDALTDEVYVYEALVGDSETPLILLTVEEVERLLALNGASIEISEWWRPLEDLPAEVRDRALNIIAESTLTETN